MRINNFLLWVAHHCLLIATRRLGSTGPRKWTDKERKCFDQGFSAGLIHGETIGYRRAMFDTLDGDIMPEVFNVKPEVTN